MIAPPSLDTSASSGRRSRQDAIMPIHISCNSHHWLNSKAGFASQQGRVGADFLPNCAIVNIRP